MLKDMRVQFDRLQDRRRADLGADDAARRGKLLSFYTRIMTKVTDSERCSVFVNDPDKGKVWLKVGTGVEEAAIEVPKEGSIVGDVIKSGKAVVVADLDTKAGAHKAVDQQTGFVTRNILCVPIKSPTRGEITGAFQILNKKDNRNFSDEDIQLAEEIAGHLQTEVDRIFLDQQVFHFTERLYATANRVVTGLSVGFGVVVLLLIVAILGRGLLPALAG
jgi:GAF domain-containing protein